MITLEELVAYCDNLLQPGLFQDYCTNGLQVQGKPQVVRIASAVSASKHVIEVAADWNADLLLVHHGIFWKDDIPVLVGVKAQKIKVLLDRGISLLAYHLPLDAHQEIGNNWRAAVEMGWRDLEPFCSHKGQSLGVKGMIPPTPPEGFKKQLEEYYKHSAAAVIVSDRPIQKVGLVSGGAYRCITDAAKAGLDAFITGNFDEPAWHLAREEGVNFFALGHAATERIGPRALGEYLGKHFGLQHCFIDEDNPF